MSSWSYALTNKGRQLQAKAQAGVQLVYTRMGVGSGTLSGQSLESMTALITPVKDLTISRLKRPAGATRALIGATLTNQDITTGFYLREVGIFATDPDDGEILYMYANAGATADYITPQGDGVIEKALNMNVFVGAAVNINANIDESLVYVTQQELADAISGIHIEDASTTKKGIVQLSNATNSTAEDRAATPKAVKSAYDAATAAQNTANAANGAAADAGTKADTAIAQLAEKAAVADVGNKTNLQTANKTNLVSAINEAFQFANNGKSDIASVVGSPATTADTFTQLKAHIQNVKNTLATSLSAKGQASSGSETLSTLVAKVAQVSTGGHASINYSVTRNYQQVGPGAVNLITLPSGTQCAVFATKSPADGELNSNGGSGLPTALEFTDNSGSVIQIALGSSDAPLYLLSLTFDIINRKIIVVKGNQQAGGTILSSEVSIPTNFNINGPMTFRVNFKYVSGSYSSVAAWVCKQVGSISWS